MEIEKILEYQKKDFEIVKLERQLNENINKKIVNEMVDKVKVSQSQSLQLEKLAQELNNEFVSLQKSYEENAKKLELITKKDLNSVSEEDLSSYENVTQTILANLSVLDKKFIALAENIKRTLSQFEEAKKNYNLAREKHKKHKQLFEVENAKFAPQIESLQKELVALEKGIDQQILAKYKQRRQDKKFPVFVPLNNQACGGCQMELSIASINSLKEKGYGECENCRRIIYVK